jgi:hypothetical protein
MWPWIFMVRSSTVFPLGVWTDIIFDALASAVIGASNAPAVSKQSENLRSRIFPSWRLSSKYQDEMIKCNSRRHTNF